MLIPVEATVERGAGTHTQTSGPRARANGMTLPTATPATHTPAEESRGERRG